MRKYEISIGYDGTVSKCKLVSEEDYKKLCSESDKANQKKIEEKVKLYETLEDLQSQIDELKQEIKVLKGEE